MLILFLLYHRSSSMWNLVGFSQPLWVTASSSVTFLWMFLRDACLLNQHLLFTHPQVVSDLNDGSNYQYLKITENSIKLVHATWMLYFTYLKPSSSFVWGTELHLSPYLLRILFTSLSHWGINSCNINTSPYVVFAHRILWDCGLTYMVDWKKSLYILNALIRYIQLGNM